MRRLSIFAPAAAGAAGVLLLSAAPSEAATGDKLDQAAVVRAMYRGAVTTAMKLKRLTLIGQICGVLSRDEAAIIQGNADALIAEEATHCHQPMPSGHAAIAKASATARSVLPVPPTRGPTKHATVLPHLAAFSARSGPGRTSRSTKTASV